MATFFSATCPSCGANINLQSQTTVMAACPYCQSNLLFSNQRLSLSGEHSAILEDYSAIQIGAVGKIKNESFQVIGRLQIQYHNADDSNQIGGTWNEWYIQFTSGRHAWLSDSNGHYVCLEKLDYGPSLLPRFEEVQAGLIIKVPNNILYYASDIREARLQKQAVQGELPFIPKSHQTIRVVDARTENLFATLDYSDDKNIEIFAGFAVDFHQLGWQNLRSQQDIKDSAGKLKGEISDSKCPKCGGTIEWIVGVAEHINCQYCGSELAINNNIAQLLVARNKRNLQAQSMALKIGQSAKIDGIEWTVIGMMCQSEIEGDEANHYIKGNLKKEYLHGSSDEWHEYLLYTYPDQFMWLVQSSTHDWAVSKTQNIWPKLRNLKPVRHNNQIMPKLYNYGGKVKYAIGSFYYQVSPGDITYYIDYGIEASKLSLEMTRNELSWSKATSIPVTRLSQWFAHSGGIQSIRFNNQASQNTINFNGTPRETLAHIFLGIFLIINIPVLLFDMGQFIISCAITAVLLYMVADRE